MNVSDDLLVRGARADQPDATAVVVGSLYCVTDEGNILEQSDGAAWNPYSPEPGDFADLGDIPDTLAAIAAVSPIANQGIRFTDGSTAEAIDITDAAVALLDDGDAAEMRTTLGLGTSAPLDVDTDGTLSANSDSKVPSQKAVAIAITNALAGLAWKQPVRVATTGPQTLATDFEAGDTIDGVTLATGDAVLIKDQTDPTENGIYYVNASGAPTRRTDADADAELVNATVTVMEGTANADTTWTCATNSPITLGSTPIAFAQVGASGASGAAGGDLTGSYPNPTVAKANGNTFPASVAKGDLIAGTAASALGKLGVGANDSILVADSTQTTGLRWATALGSGVLPSWLANHPDAPPSSPNAFDDEFETDTGPSGTAVWTWKNQSTSAYSITNGALLIQPPIQNGVEHARGLTKALPAGTAWEIRAKIGIGGAWATFSRAGLALFDNSSNKLEMICLGPGGSVCRVERWTDVDTFSSTQATLSAAKRPMYVGVERTSTQAIWKYSIDGRFWLPMFTSTLSSWISSPSDLFLVTDSNSTIDTCAIFEWIRRVA